MSVQPSSNTEEIISTKMPPKKQTEFLPLLFALVVVGFLVGLSVALLITWLQREKEVVRECVVKKGSRSEFTLGFSPDGRFRLEMEMDSSLSYGDERTIRCVQIKKKTGASARTHHLTPSFGYSPLSHQVFLSNDHLYLFRKDETVTDLYQAPSTTLNLKVYALPDTSPEMSLVAEHDFDTSLWEDFQFKKVLYDHYTDRLSLLLHKEHFLDDEPPQPTDVKLIPYELFGVDGPGVHSTVPASNFTIRSGFVERQLFLGERTLGLQIQLHGSDQMCFVTLRRDGPAKAWTPTEFDGETLGGMGLITSAVLAGKEDNLLYTCEFESGQEGPGAGVHQSVRKYTRTSNDRRFALAQTKSLVPEPDLRPNAVDVTFFGMMGMTNFPPGSECIVGLSLHPGEAAGSYLVKGQALTPVKDQEAMKVSDLGGCHISTLYEINSQTLFTQSVLQHIEGDKYIPVDNADFSMTHNTFLQKGFAPTRQNPVSQDYYIPGSDILRLKFEQP